MVILITGASHTGKTLLAQKLLKKYSCPCLSVDLLKMGLIRSGYTPLTPEDDQALEAYLWPVVREMVKTAVENRQDLIVEGCYIPFSWRKDFADAYLREIQYCCLVMSGSYIQNHFSDIKRYANVIEHRLDDSYCTMDHLLEENARCLSLCKAYGLPYVWIDREYPADIPLTQAISPVSRS